MTTDRHSAINEMLSLSRLKLSAARIAHEAGDSEAVKMLTLEGNLLEQRAEQLDAAHEATGWKTRY